MCSYFLLKNITKVSLAGQTLSNSVVVALRTLRDMGYTEFQDCEATTQFIEVMQLSIYITDEKYFPTFYYSDYVTLPLERVFSPKP